jgi:serralysin
MNMVNLVFGTVWSDNDTVQGGVFRPALNGVSWDWNIIYGYEGNDVERGAGFGDILYGHGGSDRQYGYGGNDVIYGDGANNGRGVDGGDYQYGMDGNDSLYGHGGNDYLYGGNHNDHLWGGTGYDHLWGGLNSDTFHFVQGDKDTIGSSWTPDWNAADDSIDMPIAGNAANYIEHATTLTLTADVADHASDFHDNKTYVFLYNSVNDTGYLVADLNNDDVFETSVVLAGAGAAADLHWADII